MEPPARTPQEVTRFSAASPLRRLGYAVILTALAFSQAPGRIVADTKFDLVAAPGRFLAGAARMWDAQGAFGQIQNQAVGYLWPMGPFFAVGHLLTLPAWVVQRLWWALLLNLAFFGILALARELRLGRPWAWVAAASAYVVAPRVTTILGATSVELWPTAVAPWVLLVVVRGSRRGSVVRAAALAALLVACCGGVNATAVSAVLPAGVIWLLTRARGPRRWRLLGWWALFTLLATLWWLIPLVLQGRYSPPFLDYIETARVTSSVTGLANTLLGTSNWVAYLGSAGYPAGATLVTTPFLVIDAAAVLALGLAGLAGLGRRQGRHPEARFALWCVIAGAVLVGLGYAGDLAGWGAGARQGLLDGALAALRNTHKFDVPLRLGLSLGVGLAVEGLASRRARLRARAPLARRFILGVAVVALLGLAFPWAAGQIAPPGSTDAVPDYWRQTATWLADHDDGGVALVVPAAPFGDYTWGSTHDDVLQPYADSPWAVRNVVPLADPGNVVLLDEVTELLERGTPSTELAPLLARSGVSRLVVRNDLDRLTTGAPDPALIHAALAGSPGLSLEAGFGPSVGTAALHQASDGTRVLVDGGLTGRYRSVEVYAVAGGDGDARLVPTDSTVMGDPGTPGTDGGPAVLTADSPDPGRVVLTDGQRRRAAAFQSVRDNRSATAPPGALDTPGEPEQFHRYLPDQERWQTTETWSGIDGVAASSSAADVTASPLDRGSGPAAAFDGDPGTAWRTSTSDPAGQWLRVRFQRPTDVGRVQVRIPAGAAAVGHLVLRAGSTHLVVPAPQPGASRTYDVGASAASSLTVTAEDPLGTGWWGISELDVAGVHPERLLALPTPPSGATVDEIRLSRDAGRTACPSPTGPQGAVSCLAFLGRTGDDGERLDRTLVAPGAYRLAGTASLRREPGLSTRLAAAAGVRLSATGRSLDIADSPVAMLDDDPGTSWQAPSSGAAAFRLRLPARETVRSLTLSVGAAAPVSAPLRVEVADGAGHRVVRTADAQGRLALPGWRTARLDVRIDSVRPAFSQPSGGGGATQLPPGVSELRVNGQPLTDGRLAGRCGDGPVLQLGGSRLDTAVSGSLSALLRGSSAALRICGPTAVTLPATRATVTADPGPLLEADTLTFTRAGAAGAAGSAGAPTAGAPVTSAPVTRDRHDRPVVATVAAATVARVLTLPQNANPGAVATLGGVRLTPQRVDGWRQGWVVPAGAGGTVRFSYPPETVYRWGLLAGAVGVVAVVLVALLAGRRRRSRLPALEPGSPTRVDALLLVLAAGLLVGWAGAAAAVVALVVARTARREACAAGGVAAALLAPLPRIVDLLGGRWPLADPWSQVFGVLALALVAAAVVGGGAGSGVGRSSGSRVGTRAGSRAGAKGPRFRHRIAGRSSHA